MNNNTNSSGGNSSHKNGSKAALPLSSNAGSNSNVQAASKVPPATSKDMQ